MTAGQKPHRQPRAECVYLITATDHHWTLCRENDPDEILGIFDSEERAIQAARYLAQHISGGRVRVVQADGLWETKYRHTAL